MVAADEHRDKLVARALPRRPIPVIFPVSVTCRCKLSSINGKAIKA